MSLKKDNAGSRSVEMELELPGTPEQVWQAMATGPGYAAWFVPAEIEERQGGKISFHIMEGVTSSGQVTVWQPPRRFCYEETGWSGEAPPLATEITIEAQAGGTCKVRMVHSLFTSRNDWDDEIESMEKGWPAFFRVLRIYLGAFAGMPAVSAHVRGNFAGTQDDAWQAAKQLLGLAGAREGESRDISSSGGPRLAGRVEHVGEGASKREIILRVDAPSPGTVLIGAYDWGGQVHVAMNLVFYGGDADRVMKIERPKWEIWMAEHFKAEARAP